MPPPWILGFKRSWPPAAPMNGRSFGDAALEDEGLHQISAELSTEESLLLADYSGNLTLTALNFTVADLWLSS